MEVLRSLFVDEYRRKNSQEAIKTCEIIMDKDDRLLMNTYTEQIILLSILYLE